MVNLWILNKIEEGERKAKMGMLPRAQKKQKEKMQQTLGDEFMVHVEPSQKITIQGSVNFPDSLALKLHEISQLRGISVENLVIAKMTALCNQYEKSKVLSLHHTMPYGQYQGLLVEEMIRADPRYVNWLASESDIFTLDDEALALLTELS